jgi:hypothetical protein
MYSVGRAWLPKFEGADTEFGAAMTDWLANQWYGICDIRGGMHDFRTALFLLSVAIDRDGEAFVLLTEDSTGYPRVQHIPCHRVANPGGSADGTVDSGPYRGLEMVDGIVYNKAGAPVGCAFLAKDGSLSEWLSFRDLIHLYDPAWQEQGRGLPGFTHAINDLRDGLVAHEFERLSQMAASSISMIEQNETGGPDPSDPTTILLGNCGNQTTGLTNETYAGGTVRYFRANSGAKLDTLFNPRPGQDWESFQDRMIRLSLAGINWPYSMVWKATGQGTAERSDLGKAQRAVEDRQDILLYAAKRMVNYAVAKAIKLGRLPASSDWWRVGFTLPAKLTIDDGRVSKELLDQWRAGWRNDSDILGMLGCQTSVDTHYMQRAEEVAKRKLAAMAASEKYGVEVEEREMAMLTPNEQKESEDKQNEQPDPD